MKKRGKDWVLARRIETNPWDHDNTLVKMASKRAKAAATENALAASGILLEALASRPQRDDRPPPREEAPPPDDHVAADWKAAIELELERARRVCRKAVLLGFAPIAPHVMLHGVTLESPLADPKPRRVLNSA